jgi:hypothetical protein
MGIEEGTLLFASHFALSILHFLRPISFRKQIAARDRPLTPALSHKGDC